MPLHLPAIRQTTTYDCGVAAVRCVLEYLGLPPARWAELGVTGLDGTDPRAIESYLRRKGLCVLSGEMTLADLSHFGTTGQPVLCLVAPFSQGHWVVSAGVFRGRVYYHDPAAGPCKASADEFVEWWHDLDRMGVHYRQFGLAVRRRDD